MDENGRIPGPRRGLRLRLLALASITAVVATVTQSTASPVWLLEPTPRDCLGKIAGLDLQRATIKQISKALASDRVTSTQLVKAYVKRIKAYDPKLNSVRHLDVKGALKKAGRIDRILSRNTDEGHPPMFGVPILLKDNVNTKDMPTTAGSIALKGSVPKNDAFIVKKLEKAGAIVLGKLNLSEFAGWVSLGMPPGYSSLAGQVHNAYQYTWTPSGSSAGSGVAASMAFAPATIGTETSGSILSPSDANSIVGIKPTTGLVSRTGILPLSPSFDTAGPMVRNVTDAAIVLSAIAGTDKADARTAEANENMPKAGDYTRFLKSKALKGARIGVSEQDVESLGADEQALFVRALKDLEKQGAELVSTDMLNFSKWAGLAEIAFIPNEFKASLNHYLETQTSDKLRVRTLSDIVAYNEEHPKKMKYGQDLLEASDATPGRSELEPASQAAIHAARVAIDGTLVANDLDAIVAPGPAYANVSAAAGYPTVMVPGGYSKGSSFPMGVSFLGSAWDEPELISYAYDYEQASKRRIPPTNFNADLRKTGC